MTPDLLFYPVSDVGETPARVANREVLHPTAQDRVDLLDHPAHRLLDGEILRALLNCNDNETPTRWNGVQRRVKTMSRIVALFMAAVLAASMCLAADKTNDDLIRDRVMLKLANDPDVKGGSLNVKMKDGVATLTGTVATQSEKDKTTKLAKKVKGVKQVVNNITVKTSLK
jgi:hypothetical protein